MVCTNERLVVADEEDRVAFNDLRLCSFRTDKSKIAHGCLRFSARHAEKLLFAFNDAGTAKNNFVEDEVGNHNVIKKLGDGEKARFDFSDKARLLLLLKRVSWFVASWRGDHSLTHIERLELSEKLLDFIEQSVRADAQYICVYRGRVFRKRNKR